MPVLETPEQIRREGLNALEDRLGRAGMLRFLQQFDRGHGDYATERHAWVDSTTMADIKSQLQTLRKRKASRPRRRKSD
jgi:hypothetical protein